MTLRILHLLDHLRPSAARAQTGQLGAGLRDDCHMHVASLERIAGRRECAQGAEDLRQLGVTVDALSQARGFDPLALFRLRKLVQRFKPDIVHAWQPWGHALLGLPGKSLGPAVATVDSWRSDLGGWEQRFQRAGLLRADRVVVPLVEMATRFSPVPLTAEQTYIINPGVDRESLPSEPRVTKKDLLATVGLSPNTLVVAAAGRMTRGRGLRECIWSADILGNLFPNFCLLIFGEGPERRRLAAFNRPLQGWAYTRFVGWHDLRDWWPHIELFWHSDYEPGLSQVLLEAMAAGKPVVASDTPSHRRFLSDNENASLAAVGDRTSMAKCGRRVLLDEELKHRIAAAGQQTVEDRFPLSKFLISYRALYTGLASSPATQQARATA